MTRSASLQRKGQRNDKKMLFEECISAFSNVLVQHLIVEKVRSKVQTLPYLDVC